MHRLKQDPAFGNGLLKPDFVNTNEIYRQNHDIKEKAVNKPYLSDIIDYKRDIEPYGFIQINSGVGSGKEHIHRESH